MYVTRDFEGVKSTPWEGGQYGYVRGPQRIGGEVVCTHLHEGVDIRPMERDASGAPLDIVRAAAAGTLVYANRDARASNYGRYAVIEHPMPSGAPIYTLYAHLASISAEPGQHVAQGQPIAVMGFTGDGIDRARAHLHFEIGLVLGDHFDSWYRTFIPADPNRHGNYHGMNLAGVDPAPLLIASGRSTTPDFRAYVRSLEPTFKIAFPNVPGFALPVRYPWLVASGAAGDRPPASWIVAFSYSGVPVGIEPSPVAVGEPSVAWVAPTHLPLIHSTRGFVGGTASSPRLTDSGKRLVSQLMWAGDPVRQ